MAAAMKAVMNTPELKQMWTNMGTETPDLYGDAYGKFVNSEIKRWAEVVKASGAKLD
jgi:tripartite-type tricarboxylate transporter receptor subunit TctC